MAIKSTLVTPPNKANSIDWSIPQIVEHNQDNVHTILYSTGVHTGVGFSAVVLYSNNPTHLKDLFWERWDKGSFTPITTPITITFENE